MERSDSVENPCTVCHDAIQIYAVGPCDHHVCHKCSTRMRVLCEQMDCPICRSAMPQVAFVYDKKMFKDINLRDCIPNRKNKIFYESEEIEDQYLDLLEFRCRCCPRRKAERTFAQLQVHMRRDHQLFACDICLTHLKIFPYETKFYDRKSLAAHRRMGDEDDKSYKGHPLCEFCDTRYLDKDELMKHLRKDHFFCHICDQDCSNAYYNEYADLLVHFGDSHYLCTEDECGSPTTRFTHAFSSDIDLKSHQATVHNKKSKETRTIDIDFQFAPRHQGFSRGGGSGSSNGYNDDSGSQRQRHRGDRYNNRRRQHDDPQLQRALENSLQESAEARPPVLERVPDPVRDFPSLNGAPAPPSQPATEQQKPAVTTQKPPQSVDPFPSLASSSGNGKKPQNPTKMNNKNYAAITHFSAEPRPVVKEKVKESQPVSLGNVKKVTKERWTAHAPKVTEDDYPTLVGRKNTTSRPASASAGNSSSSWLQKTTVTEAQPSVVLTPSVSVIRDKPSESTAKPPRSVPVMRPISDENEFPSLGGGTPRPESVSWSKQSSNAGSKKSSQIPKTEKLEDFELPDSFYESNEQPKQHQMKEKQQQGEKSSNQNSKKNVVLNKKEFPGLPKREVETKPADKTATSGQKKTVSKQEAFNTIDTNRKKSKKPKKGSAENSLNDIAAGLMGNASPLSLGKGDSNSKKKTDVNGNCSKASKNVSSTKVDWFDDPPKQEESKKAKTTKKESVMMPMPVLTDDNNFPSLHAMSLSVQSPDAPPGFAASPYPIQSHVPSAPPGFSNSKPAPPPGLAKPIFSMYDYIQPADFTSRNQTLVQNIRSCLETVKDGFSNFKTLSFEFRQGAINAKIYYTNIQLLIGDSDFKKIFPELVALLPDINKQQELWFEHQVVVSTRNVKRGGNYKDMSPCPKCSQIILPGDKQHHNLQHGDSQDFPSLKSTAANHRGGIRQALRI